MFDIFCSILCFIIQKYIMPHGHFNGFLDLCILQWTLLLIFSVDWPINSLLIENLTIGKYQVAVL